MPRDPHSHIEPSPKTAGNVVARNKGTRRTKVKTGCITCRIRRVKCDEFKPACHKCISTGRICDGYESPFRPFADTNGARKGGLKPLQIGRPISTMTAPLGTELLNRYFSTKTIFNVTLDCSEEANSILLASLSCPPVWLAILSLKALRENFEMCDEPFSSTVQRTQRYSHGVQQYNKALAGLMSIMSASDPRALTSALLCCQIFISIEQVQGHYSEMIKHVIQGLSIMRESQVRPYFVAPHTLMPANHKELPLLDMFVIKLFRAPSRFAEPRAIAGLNETARRKDPSELRTIVPDVRTELTRIATLTLKFLDEVSQANSVGDVVRLLCRRSSLLDSLDLWSSALELVQSSVRCPGSELISITFMRLFRLILRVVVLGTLKHSPESYAELRTTNARLQNMAILLDERLKTYPFLNGDDDS